MTDDGPRREYVEARRVLLDALTALEPHIGAFVLIGAQAVYLHSAGRLPGYQPFTTDADLAFDPERLADAPLLADAMVAAGFVYSGEPGVWHRSIDRGGGADEVVVPVDLIVPDQIAPKSGRRGARLPRGHGRTAARKAAGVEGALVDHGPLEICSFETADPRRLFVNVAGPGALLVAKAHKLGERLRAPHRLLPKDAGDVFRLYEATAISDMTSLLKSLLADDRSADATSTAIDYLRDLFATPRSPGIPLAVNALSVAVDAATVTSTMTGRTRELLTALSER